MKEKQIEPRNRMGVTKHLFSDSHAGMITGILSPTKIEVHYFKYPSYGDNEEIEPSYSKIDDSHEPEIWTLRKSGNWRLKGRPDKWGECYLTLGKAWNYYCKED
jgi:hypothetical protein